MAKNSSWPVTGDLNATVAAVRIATIHCPHTMQYTLMVFANFLLQLLNGYHFDSTDSTVKQQISWVVSLWQSALTFVWPGIPKDGWLGLIGASLDGDQNAIQWYFSLIQLLFSSQFRSFFKVQRSKICSFLVLYVWHCKLQNIMPR